MITLDWILNLAISTIKANFPEALTVGQIVNDSKTFNASDNTVTSNTVSENVELVSESLTQEEIQASGLLQSDLKIYVICNNDYDLNFYSKIVFMSKEYRVKKIVDSLVGSKIALWTVIVTK